MNVWTPASGGRPPNLEVMIKWDSEKVRIIEVYDINWDAIVRQFDYLGPTILSHGVRQLVSPNRDKMLSGVGVKKRGLVKRTFRPDGLTTKDMVNILRDHWERTYA